MSDSEFESSGHEDSDSSSPPKKKFKPNMLHENVVVKVDGKLYHLNRVQLALKSNYFEKLFVEDFAEKNSDVVELRELNSDGFSAIVDLINGKDLKSVVNADNYLAVLMGLDYLQMEIDLTLFKSFIVNSNVVQVIALYNFVTVNQNYRYFESEILKSISVQLIGIIKYDEKFILSLPFEHFFKIIRRSNVMWDEFCCVRTIRAKQTLSQICANWIYHDVENRLQHFPEIVNAANYGFYTYSFIIPNEKVEALLDEIKKDTSLERIEKCFQQLLSYRGEINPDVGQFRLGLGAKSLGKNRLVNKIDENEKLTRFLNEGHLSDVTVRAGAKTYKLHRYILDTASTYFSGPIPTSNKNSELVLDIDEKTFDLIVDFIYFDKIPEFDSNSKTVVIQLLKAATILKSKLVIEKCCVPWMEKLKETFNSEEIAEILNLAVGNNCQSESWVTTVLERFIYRLKGNQISKDVFHVWQLCEAAGLEELSGDFRSRLISAIDFNDTKYEDLLKAFDVICEVNNGGKYSRLYIACLCKLLVAPRSEISVETHFVSVSCDVLEELLASDHFIISEAQKIVDICSKWIAHDVQNRYRLIPRIIFAINRNSSMDLSDFESNIPSDLSTCSQEVVNGELWKLLNSNCLLSRDLGSVKTSWDFKTRPMFIQPKNVDKKTRIPKKVCVLDSELNEMVSLNFLTSHYSVGPKWDRLWDPKLSATLIGDTLFILCEIRCEFNVYAYNFSSKKLKILGPTPRPMSYPMDTLLSCNNELFWCFLDGHVMKYSFELNRWLKLYSESERHHYGPYGSDENKLLRYHNDTLQIFDFEQSSWTHLADLPSSSNLPRFRHLTNFHNGFALVSLPMEGDIYLFHSDTRSWKKVSRPAYPNQRFDRPFGLFESFNAEAAPYGEDLLYVHENGIAQLPRSSFSSGRWRMKKLSSSSCKFDGIVAIHSMSCANP